MAKGIEIGVAVDGQAAKKGIETGLIDPLEDAGKALDELGKSKGPDQLEKGLKETQKATDNLRKETKETADAIEREYKASYAKLKQSADKGFQGASEGSTTFKQEAKQNAEEVASSFDGSAESIADGFQSVAATAFSGFGPAGVVAGLAAAAGIGLISQAITQGTEDGEAFREKVSDFTAELIEAGNEGGPSIDYIVERLKDLATESEDGATNLKDLFKQSANAASSFEKIAQAYAGNAEGLEEIIKLEEERFALLEEENDKTSEFSTIASLAASRRVEDQKKIVDGLKDQQEVSADAAKADEAYARSGALELEQKAALIGSVNDAYDDAASAVNDYVDAETGILDTEGYLTAIEARSQALRDFQTNLRELPAESLPFLATLGAEEAATLAQGYIDATPAQKERLGAVWREAGSATSGEYIAGAQAGFTGQEIEGPKVLLPVDTKETETTFSELATTPRTAAPVQTSADDKAGLAIDAVAAKPRSATIKVTADTSAAQSAIDALVSRNNGRVISLTVEGKTRSGERLI